MVELGKKYRDSLTGHEGTATSRTEYLHGCVRVCLESGGDSGPAEHWFDEQRLTDKSPATSGGQRPAPPARRAG